MVIVRAIKDNVVELALAASLTVTLLAVSVPAIAG
jgi:hypothetical protein